MPNFESEQDPSLRLTRALLVYEVGGWDRSDEVVITHHEVTDGVIQPGTPLDMAAFAKLVERGQSKDKESKSGWAMQFPRLLGESQHHIAWWSPPGIQRVFIGKEDGNAKAVRAWVPGLVWIASRQHATCFLHAYDGAGAPTLHTDMYRPQFGPSVNNHVHADGRICNGSMKLDGNTPEAWEKAFWSSRFKTNGHLNSTKPYACKKAFKRIGTLASVLPCGPSAD